MNSCIVYGKGERESDRDGDSGFDGKDVRENDPDPYGKVIPDSNSENESDLEDKGKDQVQGKDKDKDKDGEQFKSQRFPVLRN